MRKWPYLSPEVKNEKNKGTLFSTLLKVGENKVVLDFSFNAYGLRYGDFLVLSKKPDVSVNQKFLNENLLS